MPSLDEHDDVAGPSRMDAETGDEVGQRKTLTLTEPRLGELLRRSTSPAEDTLSELPSPSLLPSPFVKTKPLPLRTRNLSPSSSSSSLSSRGRVSPHMSPKSSPRTLVPPAMMRAHSMPVMDEAGRHLLSPTSAVRSSSPLGSGRSYRSSSSRRSDETSIDPSARYLPFLTEPVPEDSELESSTPRPRVAYPSQSSPHVPLNPGNTFPRRRPQAPIIRPLVQPPALGFIPSTPTSTTSSPVLPPTRFNEAYPSASSTASSYPFSFSSNSSLPSTPTSARSRSPSISSLETIPDSPDAEEAALEAERILRLKEAADAADGGGKGHIGHRRRSSVDNTVGGGSSKTGAGLVVQVMGSYGTSSRDKKKRWSVCGGERRGDLDLETIWED